MGSVVFCAACGDSDAIRSLLSNLERGIWAASAGGYLKLLAHGADVHANSNVVSVALMCDSACGHDTCIEVLLAHSANVLAKSIVGVTALIAASFVGVLQAHSVSNGASDSASIEA